MESAGIKETKEVVVAAVSLAAVLAAAFKDGVQAEDFAVVFAKIQGDEALKAKLLDAYNGADKVPSEAKDLSLAESLEILVAVIPEIKKLIEAVRA